MKDTESAEKRKGYRDIKRSMYCTVVEKYNTWETYRIGKTVSIVGMYWVMETKPFFVNLTINCSHKFKKN